MSRKKLIRLFVILAILILVVLAIAKKKGWLGNDEGIRVSTEYAMRRDIVETVSANGRIQPESEVKVSPDISGEIIELFVKEGDELEAGEILAKVDPELYKSDYDQMLATLNSQKANLSNARARLAQVRAQYINAENAYKRNEKLYTEKVISASDFDAAKASYEVAKAEVDAAKESVNGAQYAVVNAEAALKKAKENLTKTTIYAPTSGTIYNLSVEKGERVVGASQFSSGTEIMRIANLNNMEANVEVNENDIVRVDIGDTALIEVDAYLDRKFKGVVTEIANSANITGLSADQVTNFDVKIRILQSSYEDLLDKKEKNLSPFRPGMSTTVEIQTARVMDILALPIQAVTTRDDSTGRNKTRYEQMKESKEEDKKEEEELQEEVKEYVFLFKEGKAVMQEVETGIQDKKFIEITTGLKDSVEVITDPYSAVSKELKNNDEVKKVDKKTLFKVE